MFTEAIKHLQQQLQQAGLSAAIDPRDLLLPGIWLTPDTGGASSLAGNFGEVTINLACIVPNRGASADLAALDKLIAKAEKAVSPASWRIEAISLPNLSADPLPAASCKLTIEWSK